MWKNSVNAFKQIALYVVICTLKQSIKNGKVFSMTALYNYMGLRTRQSGALPCSQLEYTLQEKVTGFFFLFGEEASLPSVYPGRH